MGFTQDAEGTIYLAGGDDWDGRFYNDIWCSSDRGSTWKLVNSSNDWIPRAGHVLLCDETQSSTSLVLFGGNSRGLKPQKISNENEDLQRQSDVWKSFDGGLSWVKLTSHAEFGKRTMMRAVNHCHRIVAIGGWLGTDVARKEHIFDADVWLSEGDEFREKVDRHFVALFLRNQVEMDVCLGSILPFLYGN
jgi:hypothetical protein